MIKTDLDAFEIFRETKEQSFVILKGKPNIQLKFIRIRRNVKREPFNASIELLKYLIKRSDLFYHIAWREITLYACPYLHFSDAGNR